jgi:hypothetical protein
LTTEAKAVVNEAAFGAGTSTYTFDSTKGTGEELELQALADIANAVHKIENIFIAVA